LQESEDLSQYSEDYFGYKIFYEKSFPKKDRGCTILVKESLIPIVYHPKEPLFKKYAEMRSSSL